MIAALIVALVLSLSSGSAAPSTATPADVTNPNTPPPCGLEPQCD